MNNQVSLSLLKLDGENVKLVLVKYERLNSSQVKHFNCCVVGLVLDDHLINLLIVLILYQEDVDFVLLLVVDNQILLAVLQGHEDFAFTLGVI